MLRPRRLRWRHVEYEVRGPRAVRVLRRFRDKVTVALEAHVARLQASVATNAHQERPEYLDRLSVLRNQIFVLDHMYMSVFATAGWILRLGVTVVLLAAISPVLLLLALFALPTVATSSWRPAALKLMARVLLRPPTSGSATCIARSRGLRPFLPSCQSSSVPLDSTTCSTGASAASNGVAACAAPGCEIAKPVQLSVMSGVASA